MTNTETLKTVSRWAKGNEDKKPIAKQIAQLFTVWRAKANQTVNRTCIIAGMILGSIVPLLVYTAIHIALAAKSCDLLLYFAGGGLAFSCITVINWAKIAFGNGLLGWIKAVGFVVLLEGLMTGLAYYAHQMEGVSMYASYITSGLCLIVLMFINGAATTSNLLTDIKTTPKRK